MIGFTLVSVKAFPDTYPPAVCTPPPGVRKPAFHKSILKLSFTEA